MVEHDPGLKSTAEKQPSNKPYERWNRQTQSKAYESEAPTQEG